MSKPNELLRLWMRVATTAQQEQLARLAATSRKVLYNLAGGARRASAAKAVALEKAALKVRGSAKLPPLTRGDFCEACRKCEYARFYLKERNGK